MEPILVADDGFLGTSVRGDRLESGNGQLWVCDESDGEGEKKERKNHLFIS